MPDDFAVALQAMDVKVNLPEVKLRLLLACCLSCCIAAASAENLPENNASVITAEDIRREHPASVFDLLRTRAGVDNSSGTITMRGVQGVAVILNGLPSSLTDLNQLNLDDVERIEVLRGAASARFGANAMGGAIIVSTRRTAARPVVTLLTSSSGSLGARFNGELAPGPWRLGVTLKDENERGYRATPYAPYPSQITVEDEHYRRKSAALRADYQRGSGKLGLEVKRSDSLSHYGRPNWRENYATASGRVSAATQLDSGAEFELRAARENYDDLGLLDAGISTGAAGLAPDRNIISGGARNDAELAVAWRGESTGLRLGTVYQRARDRTAIRPYGGNSDTFLLDSVTINRALFAHLDRRIGAAVEVAFDGRFDRHEYPDVFVFDALGTAPVPAAGVVKQSFNPKLEALWHVSEAVSMNVSAGTGFVPPTPDQLYYSDMGAASWMLGNPALKPQRSQTQDIGLNVQHGEEWSVATSLFHTAWTDKIGVAIIDYGVPLKRQFANIGAAESNGLEFESRLRLGASWSATLNYTYNNARIVRDQAHPARTGNSLPDMPRHKLNAVLAYEAGDLSGRLALRAIGASFTDEANTRIDARGYRWDKSGYTVLDAALTRRFSGLDVSVSLDNVFDRRYATGFFRAGQPRLLRVEANWRL